MKIAALKKKLVHDPFLNLIKDDFPQKDIYLVGGYLRDMLLGRQSEDYDFTLKDDPANLVKILKKKHGGAIVPLSDDPPTVRWVYKKKTFDFSIFKGSSISQDLKCRDLTINALCYDIETEEVIDENNSYNDIEKGIIRKLDDKSFENDPLRILRIFRYNAQFGFTLASGLLDEIKEKVHLLESISKERIKYEMDLIFESERFRATFGLLLQGDVIYTLIPDFRKMKGYE